jgi:hypothetical protein
MINNQTLLVKFKHLFGRNTEIGWLIFIQLFNTTFYDT